MVDAPEEFDIPVGSESHPIARLVQPRSGLTAEWIGDKHLCGQLRLVQILPRQSMAPDVQLPVHANRHRLHAAIQNVHPCVADRSSNRNGLLDAAPGRHDVTAGEGGVLSRTVSVDKPILSDHLEHPAHMGNRQRLSPCQQLAHPLQALDLLVHHLVKQRCRQPKRSHPTILNQPPQLLQRQRPRGTHHQPGTVEQTAPKLQGRRIKRDRRKLQEHLLRTQLQVVG